MLPKPRAGPSLRQLNYKNNSAHPFNQKNKNLSTGITLTQDFLVIKTSIKEKQENKLRNHPYKQPQLRGGDFLY